MRGHLTIGGHHGNRLRCKVHLSIYNCICSCIRLQPIEESNFPESPAVTIETKLKKSSFSEIPCIFR